MNDAHPPASPERDEAGFPSAPLNPGADFDLPWVVDAVVDESALAAELARRSDDPGVSPALERAELLATIRSIDLTTLNSDDTPDVVRALCARARDPLPGPLLEHFDGIQAQPRVAAVCVYPFFLGVARRALEGTQIPVAVTAAGFPSGLSPLRQRVEEVRSCVAAGADEIDVVINRSLVLTGEWEALYAEVRAFRQAAGATSLKVILATGELRTMSNVARAARVCLLAGADFLKTSTGKEAVNATLEAGAVMLREISGYQASRGHTAGFKAAGGIRSPGQALDWRRLVREIRGGEALDPGYFRLGASGLLGAVVERLRELLSGESEGGSAEGRVPTDY